jgi:signal transduction histidine kinase
MRRDFVANVSHELRTPLTVLVGFLETVRELKLDPERSRDYLNLMSEQSKRMQRIIDDLLTLSMLESAPEPPQGEVEAGDGAGHTNSAIAIVIGVFLVLAIRQSAAQVPGAVHPLLSIPRGRQERGLGQVGPVRIVHEQ